MGLQGFYSPVQRVYFQIVVNGIALYERFQDRKPLNEKVKSDQRCAPSLFDLVNMDIFVDHRNRTYRN